MVLSNITEVTDTCLQLARVGSCDFFTCLEERFPCGHDGYAIRIAKHFCDRGVGINSMLNADVSVPLPIYAY